MEQIASPLREQLFSAGKIQEYVTAYGQAVNEAWKTIDQGAMSRVFDILEKSSKAGSHVYIAGNGGSAAIADHLCCDWMKGTYIQGKPPIRSLSMMSNVALLTAYSNDYSYEDALSKQLDSLGKPGDVVLAISSSGNSPNVVNLIKRAKEMGLATIALTGFKGGTLKSIADVCVYVNYHDYGVVEDCHQMVMHCLAHYLTKARM